MINFEKVALSESFDKNALASFLYAIPLKSISLFSETIQAFQRHPTLLAIAINLFFNLLKVWG